MLEPEVEQEAGVGAAGRARPPGPAAARRHRTPTGTVRARPRRPRGCGSVRGRWPGPALATAHPARAPAPTGRAPPGGPEPTAGWPRRWHVDVGIGAPGPMSASTNRIRSEAPRHHPGLWSFVTGDNDHHRAAAGRVHAANDPVTPPLAAPGSTTDGKPVASHGHKLTAPRAGHRQGPGVAVAGLPGHRPLPLRGRGNVTELARPGQPKCSHPGDRHRGARHRNPAPPRVLNDRHLAAETDPPATTSTPTAPTPAG